MANTDPQEFKLIDKNLSTVKSIMPAISGRLYLELNESGSGAVDVQLGSVTAGLVENGQFAQVNYRGSARGGFLVENIGKKQADSEEGAGKVLSISGRGALSMLDSAIVEYDGLGSTREFTAKTKGYILKTFIDEAQARGELAGITYTFTATDDSASVAWTDSETISFPVGMSLLDVVRQFVQQGIDFWLDTSTWELNAYKNGKGTDKSETIYFRVGTNCEEVYSDERGNDIINDYLVAYEGGYVTVTDPTSISAYGRKRALLDLKNAQTAASATTYAAAKVAQTKNPKKSISVKIYDGIGPKAFVDYDLGDYIMLDVEGVETKYRIYGIQLNWTDDGYADIVVDLNSVFYSHEINLDRDLNWLLDQWETARDGKLLEVSYWADCVFPGNSNPIYDMLIVGRKLYLSNDGKLWSYDLDSRVWAYIPLLASFGLCLEAVGTDLYIGCDIDVEKYDTLTGIVTQVAALNAFEIGDSVYRMAAMGTTLYVAGVFGGIGGVDSYGIIEYETTTDTWTALNDIASFVLIGSTGSMLVIGSDLYTAKFKVQKYNGTVFADVGVFPTNNKVIYKMVEYGTSILASTDDGIYEWDGLTWAVFGGTIDGAVKDMVVYLTDVYAVGSFTNIGNRIARYSGGSWWILDVGLNNTTNYIVLDDNDAIVSGIFTEAGGKPANYVAGYFTNFNSLLDFLENSDSGSFNMGAAIHAAPASAITDADEVPFWEDVFNALRKITWANIKATLKTYFDTLYIPATGYTADRVLVTDGTGAITTDTQLRYSSTSDALFQGDITDNIAKGFHQGNDGAGATHTMFSWGDFSSYIKSFRALGTKASPTAVIDGTELARWRGAGYNGTTVLGITNTSADARLVAAETHSPTAAGTRFEVYTTPNGSTTLTKALTVDNTQANLEAGTYNVGGSPHTQNADTIIIPSGAGTPTYNDLQDYLNLTQASGRLTGGVLSAHAGPNGTLDISEMEGMIHTANTLGSPIVYFKKAATASISLTDNAVNFIWITYTAPGGVPTLTYSANAARPTDDYNVFVVGRVWRSGNDVEVVNSGQNIFNMYGRQQDRLLTKYGNLDHATGAILTQHATALRIEANAGVWYFGNTRIDTAAVDTFRVWYKTGGGAWTESAELTLFSDVFDGGTSKVYETYQNGTSLGTLSGNAYGVYWIYECPEGDLYVVLGTSSYANVAAAQAATIPASLPPYVVNWSRLIGRVIVKKTAAALYSVESAFSQTFALSTTIDHNSTSNINGTSPYYHLPTPTAPAANLMNVAGIVNGETDWSNKPLFDATNPADLAATAAPGTSLLAAHRDHVHAGGASSLDNGLINGGFDFFQRIAPATATAMVNDSYNAPDRWYSLVQGANATINREAGIGTSQYSCKLVAGGTTNRYGIAQIMEANKSIPYRGQTIVSQIRIKPVNNAGSGTRKYRIAILEWTGTANSVSSELVADWTSSTFTTAGFFASTTKTLVGCATVTATHNIETVLSVSGAVSTSCNNLIVFIWTEDVPTHASDYVLLGEAGLDVGTTAKTWKARHPDTEYALCTRHCRAWTNGASDAGVVRFAPAFGLDTVNAAGYLPFSQPMFATPSITLVGAGWNFYDFTGAGLIAITGASVAATSENKTVAITFTAASGLVAGRSYVPLNITNEYKSLILSSEL